MVLVAGLLLPFASTARSQDSQGDSIYVSGQIDSLSTASGGGGAGLEWAHPISTRAGLGVGVLSFVLAGSHWSFAKLSAYHKPGERMVVYGELDRGAGQTVDGGMTYRVLKGGVTQALIKRRLYVDVEDQYLHIGDAEDNLVRTGVILQPAASLGTRLNYNFSTAGNVGSRFLSGRLDWTGSKLDVLGGFTVGRTSPESFNLVANGGGSERSREFFGGVSIPAGRSKITFVLDNLQLAETNKYTASLTCKLPLERPPSAQHAPSFR